MWDSRLKPACVRKWLNTRFPCLKISPEKSYISSIRFQGTNHWLSRRCDGSHHHKWDLLWTRSPIREWHIWWQIWHSNLLVDDGSAFTQIPFRLQLLNTLYFELFYCWLARGSPVSSVCCKCFQFRQWFSVVFRQSLYRLYCPPGRRYPWWSCH